MHDSKQPKSWHRQPSLRAVLPAKHGMLWEKQLRKQETQSLHRKKKILPQHFFPHISSHVSPGSLAQISSNLLGNYHQMGEN